MIRTTVHLTLRRIDPVWPLAAFYFILLLLVCTAVGLTAPASADDAATTRAADVVYVVATPTAQPAPLLADTLGEKGAPPPLPTPAPQVVYEVVYVAAPPAQVDMTPEGDSSSASTRGRP